MATARLALLYDRILAGMLSSAGEKKKRLVRGLSNYNPLCPLLMLRNLSIISLSLQHRQFLVVCIFYFYKMTMETIIRFMLSASVIVYIVAGL